MRRARPRPGLRDVEPYESPQPKVAARLNTNESPYPLPSGFRTDLARSIADRALNRYPDRDATAVRSRLAELEHITVDRVWVANGSNEILLQLLQAYGGSERRAVVFEPTYSMYARLGWVTGTDVVPIALEEPWRIDEGAIERAREAEPHVIFVCSPNNPTGNLQDGSTIGALAESDALVVVDEAYIEFGGQTVSGLIARYPNIVVVRTFSKAYALAGARIGFCVADPEVVVDLRRVRLPYHVSALTDAAGLAAIAHRGDAVTILETIRHERDRILAELPPLGVRAFPSCANFVLFRPPRDAGEVWRALLDRGVLVRDMTASVPNALRVTAGTPAEIDLFLTSLREVLS